MNFNKFSISGAESKKIDNREEIEERENKWKILYFMCVYTCI